LPVDKDAQAAVEGGAPDANAATSTERTVALVVDDELAVREVLREALEAEGCEVLTAESGEVALNIYDARGGKLDIVFTYSGMPEMSGWELAREIRKRSKSIPLAIVSGWADAISCDARQAIKADWVVSKPFDIATIAQIANDVSELRSDATSAQLEAVDLHSLLGM